MKTQYNLETKLRDAIINYCKTKGFINSSLDERFTYKIENNE